MIFSNPYLWIVWGILFVISYAVLVGFESEDKKRERQFINGMYKYRRKLEADKNFRKDRERRRLAEKEWRDAESKKYRERQNKLKKGL